MSAFDRDIWGRVEGGGGSGVTLCALAWPRGFCCHSWWQWLSPCRLNWCLQICPGCTFFPLLGSTSWWWVADETERFPTLTLALPSHSLEWLTRRSGAMLPRSAFFSARRTLQYYRLFTFEGSADTYSLLGVGSGLLNIDTPDFWQQTPFYPPQNFHSVTIDMSDSVVLSSWSCYSWSVRMCSEFKDTVGCFHRCLFFHGTPTSKRSAPFAS